MAQRRFVRSTATFTTPKHLLGNGLDHAVRTQLFPFFSYHRTALVDMRAYHPQHSDFVHCDQERETSTSPMPPLLRMDPVVNLPNRITNHTYPESSEHSSNTASDDLSNSKEHATASELDLSLPPRPDFPLGHKSRKHSVKSDLSATTSSDRAGISRLSVLSDPFQPKDAMHPRSPGSGGMDMMAHRMSSDELHHPANAPDVHLMTEQNPDSFASSANKGPVVVNHSGNASATPSTTLTTSTALAEQPPIDGYEVLIRSAREKERQLQRRVQELEKGKQDAIVAWMRRRAMAAAARQWEKDWLEFMPGERSQRPLFAFFNSAFELTQSRASSVLLCHSRRHSPHPIREFYRNRPLDGGHCRRWSVSRTEGGPDGCREWP